MFTISIDPIIFSIGHFAVRWYGIILMIAMGIGIWLTAREAERKGFKKDDVYDAAVWIIIGGNSADSRPSGTAISVVSRSSMRTFRISR